MSVGNRRSESAWILHDMKMSPRLNTLCTRASIKEKLRGLDGVQMVSPSDGLCPHPFDGGKA